MSEERIQEIQRRWNNTTPGPWKSSIEGRDHESGSSFIRTGGEDFEISGATDADLDFIAHAKQDMQCLLTEIQKLNEHSI